MDLNKNYYSILGLNKNCNEKEIKKAFRTLSKKYHPDKNDGNDTKFKEINEANSILSGSERKKYDTCSKFGNDYTKRSSFNSFDPFNNKFDNGFNSGFEKDIFKEYFGSMGNMKNKRKSPEELNIETTIILTLEDIYNNFGKTIKFKRRVYCDKCDGTGKNLKGKKVVCGMCNGLGMTKYGTSCEHCNGRGMIYTEKCPHCKDGLIKKDFSFELNNIYKLKNEEVKFLKGYGHKSSSLHNVSGDLVLHIEIEDKKNYKINGFSIYHTMDVHYRDLIEGKDILFDNLDKTKLKLHIPEKSNDKKLIRLKGKGLLKNKNTRGDLYLLLNAYIDYDKE